MKRSKKEISDASRKRMIANFHAKSKAAERGPTKSPKTEPVAQPVASNQNMASAWKLVSSTPKDLFYSMEWTNPSREAIDNAAQDIVKILDQTQERTWNMLRLEYWGEGRLLLIPAHADNRYRIDDVCFEFLLSEVKHRKAKIDALGEAEAERMTLLLYRELNETFTSAFAATVGVPVAFLPYGEEDPDL